MNSETVRRYSGDPYWVTIRRRDVCLGCHSEMKPGERGFYFPRTRSVYCDAPNCGQAAEARFLAEAQDEEFLSSSHS